MKIAIYGAGAIGGYVGALLSQSGLSQSGVDVSLIARGPHLEAIKNSGLKLVLEDETIVTHPVATDTPAGLGVQDYIIVTLKAHSAVHIVDAMQPMIGPDTAIVTMMNGVPWWYFYKLDGAWENRVIKTVDPDAKQWNGLGPERVIGCVVYPACEITEPGTVKHMYGDRFTLGEPSGEKTDRVKALAGAMIAAGLKAPIRNIRDDIWLKLWGNLCFNPLSALTHAKLDVLATNPGTQGVARNMMLEAQTIGEKLGVRFRIDVDKRIKGAADVGAHTTSMLQDLQLGRPMEIDALLSAVQELGQIVDVDTPTIDTVLPIVQLRAQVAGCY